MNTLVKKILIVVVWLLIWEGISLAVGNTLLLAGPVEVLVRLASDVVTVAFWASIAFSGLRIIAGFVIACILAFVLGTLAWRITLVREFLAPAISFIKSVPVVCIIVLLLVWMGSSWVSIAAVALMVFPPLYFNYLEGLEQADANMVQMLNAFHVSPWRRIRYYYWPTTLPYVVSAARVVVGISWKAGIAAEVIGIPNGSIGEGIYLSKIGLDTAGLFSWTITIVVLSVVCEKIVLWLLERAGAWSAHVGTRPKADRASSDSNRVDDSVRGDIAFESASFSYHEDAAVIRNYTRAFEAGKRYCLMGPSGSGKSTLLMLASGILRPQAGNVQAPACVSVQFQENRLLNWLSAWDNVRFTASPPATDLQELKSDLDGILGRDSACLSIADCSGGMKRKVALMRALAAPGDALILDEPFTGMDDASKNEAAVLIDRYLRGRTLLVATHDADDIQRLCADLVSL